MRKSSIVVIMGKTSCGKTYLMNKLIEKLPNLNKVVTYTSRPPRENEQNGIDYWFASREEMLDMISNGDMLEWASYNTIYGEWLYGTHYLSFSNDEKEYIVVLDYEGFKKVQRIFPNRVIGFMIHLDDDIREFECMKRGTSIEEFIRRTKEDNEKFQLVEEDNSIYHVLNCLDDSGTQALNIINLLIKGVDKDGTN